MAPQPQGHPFGRYRLLEVIGQGGMGEVHLALGPGVQGFEKRVAIKRLRLPQAEEAGSVGRFLDEARLGVQLSHGNIVSVFEVGCVDGEYFLVMEYVDGCDLGVVMQRLRDSARLCPVTLALYIAHEVSRGLDHAHRQTDAAGDPLHIVHRDVSPQNILLGRDGSVRVADFGIAKAVGRSQRTRTGALIGKFSYMSPEQALGHPLDARSDVFALGIVLYELLSGRPLFDGDTDPEVLRKVQDARVLPLSLHRDDLPASLETLVLRALARNPGDRFASMAEMGAALGMLLYRGQPAGSVELAAMLKDLRPQRPRTPARLEAPRLDVLPSLGRRTATLAPLEVDEGLEMLAFPGRRRRWALAATLGIAAVAAATLSPWRDSNAPAQAAPSTVAPSAGAAPMVSAKARSPGAARTPPPKSVQR